MSKRRPFTRDPRAALGGNVKQKAGNGGKVRASHCLTVSIFFKTLARSSAKINVSW